MRGGHAWTITRTPILTGGLRLRLYATNQVGGVRSAPCPCLPVLEGTSDHAREALQRIQKNVLLKSSRKSACLVVHSCTHGHKASRALRQLMPAQSSFPPLPPWEVALRHRPETKWMTTAQLGTRDRVRSAPCPVPPSFGAVRRITLAELFNASKNVLLKSSRESACPVCLLTLDQALRKLWELGGCDNLYYKLVAPFGPQQMLKPLRSVRS